jgi:hypothetical protein
LPVPWPCTAVIIPVCVYTGTKPLSAPLPSDASKIMVTVSFWLGKGGLTETTWAPSKIGAKKRNIRFSKFFIMRFGYLGEITKFIN